MSTAELDPISRACRLLREGAAELKNCHTPAATGHDWTGEPEAKAAYDEHMATADALERWADSIGAGGVESLRGRQCLHRISEPAGEYPALPEPDTRWRAQFAGHGVSFHSEDQIIRFTNERVRAAVDADRAMRVAQPAGVQQPGVAGLVGALEDAQRAINSMKVEAETAAQGDEQMMLEACETISNEGLQADMAIRAALASHGQAPASRKPKADSVDYVTEWAVTLWKGRERIRKELRASHGQAQAAPQPSPAPQGNTQIAPADVLLRTAIAETLYQQVRIEHDNRIGPWSAFDVREQQRIVDSIQGLCSVFAPASQGNELVPVEPTKEMWAAVNRLDDEMAAGGYDGRGCSIEQAWHCLLAAAPQTVVREAFHKDTGCTPGGDINLAERVCGVVERAHGITTTGRKDAP